MLWWHQKVLGHRVGFERLASKTVWDGSTIPERTVATCSCGKVWVRREDGLR